MYWEPGYVSDSSHGRFDRPDIQLIELLPEAVLNVADRNVHAGDSVLRKRAPEN
jgi:hypothetical protein